MKIYALAMIGIMSVGVAPKSQAQQGVPALSQITPQKSQGLWQKLVVPTDNPDGIDIYDGFSSFGDWIAASYEERSGRLFKREGDLTGSQIIYEVNGSGVGSYLFDPVLTQDKMFFRFGKVENPIDGFKLLYVNKDVKPLQVYWVSANSLYYTRIEISPSSRYIAYMTSGGYDSPQHIFHNETMALWVTDIQANKTAQVDVGDWITGTYWWDGDTLRFLNLKQQPVASQSVVSRKSPTLTKKSTETHEFIESKQFNVTTGLTQVLRTQPYQESRFLLESYYNAFFGGGYTRAAPKDYVTNCLPESVLFDAKHHQILFATLTSVVKQETVSNGRSFYKPQYAIIAMTGANTFTKVGEFSLRSFEDKPAIKLFRVGKRLFMGVKSFSSTRSTYAPHSDVFFPARTMTIYELKNGKAEIVRQEENCFGLSQLIDGASVFASY